MTRTFDELVRRLLPTGVSPYTDFPSDAPVEQWFGWDAKHPWFHQAVDELRPHVVIEVGAFLGGSAIHMADRLRELGLDSAIICIDTWLAEETLWTNWPGKMRFRHGRPEFYSTFLANVLDAGLQEHILPLSMDSIAAARYLRHKEVAASLVYIDGSHQRGDVLRDIEHYWDLLDPGGVMLMDDYENKGIVSFVAWDLREFSARLGVPFEHQGLKARMRKP